MIFINILDIYSIKLYNSNNDNEGGMPMKIARTVLYLLVLILIVVFSVQNASDQITLKFFGYSTGQIAAIEALLLSFILGIVVTGVYSLWKYSNLLKKYKKALKEVEDLKNEIKNIRKLNVEEGKESQ